MVSDIINQCVAEAKFIGDEGYPLSAYVFQEAAREISELRKTISELDAAAEAEAQKYEDYVLRGVGV